MKENVFTHKVQIKLVPTYTLSNILLIACRHCWQRMIIVQSWGTVRTLYFDGRGINRCEALIRLYYSPAVPAPSMGFTLKIKPERVVVKLKTLNIDLRFSTLLY